MKTHWKKLVACSLAAAICLLSGCTSAPDTRDDPLSGYNVNALPFGTRVPDAASTTTPTQTPVPSSTDIVSLPQDWQNESAPESDRSTDVPTRVPTQKPTATPMITPTRTTHSYIKLEQGDKGEEVQRLQTRLIELGYLSGTADGVYGANTKNAVKRFQKALGISQTGVAYVSLQEKLFMSTAPTYQIDLSTTATPDPNALSRYTVLVRGDKGEDVLKLQQRLIELGYLTGTADGDFGANTENAVKRFQGVLGVSQTGVASAVMQSQLYASTAPYAPAPTQAPTHVPTPVPTQKPQSTTSYQQLEPGDTGDAVVQMQNRLKELGYFSGSATGNYYRETTAAVQRFQKAIGMSETGVASSSMLIQLYSSSAPSYSDSVQTDPTTPAGGYTTLHRGSTGTEVVNLQKRLISLGYLTGSADGDFGAATENAIKLFQKTIGFEQNGIASVGLQNLLFSSAAPVYVPETTSVPTTVPTVPPTQAPSSRYQQLNPGDTGAAVKEMQTRLKELGFFSGQLGGNYLDKTTASVKLFQAAINHAQTGVATSEMLEILYSEDAPDYDSVESDYVTLEKLDSGIQVLYLQQRLKELGYLTGSADGDFGTQTENAVKAFQKQVNLTVTGKATPETQTFLFSSAAPSAPSAATQAPTSIPTQIPTQVPTQVPAQTGYTTLENGDSGEAVKKIQSRLKQLGYFEGNIGGNYLLKTETAVRLFQAQTGFSADGVATAAVQEYLFSSAAPAYNGSAYISLSKSMTGPAVRNLQAALIREGYLSGSADGDFGGGTEKAVKKLQNALNMDDDGIASVELQRILFSGNGMPTATNVPTQAPTQVPSAPTQPPVSGSTEYRTIKAGASGEDVLAIQQRLMELGYYDGLLKGNFKSITELSFKLFQAAAGYTPDGIATAALQELLFSENAPRYNGDVFVDLENSDEGVAVKRLQQRLIDLGYLSGTADGEYGGNTQSAVKKFQKQIGYSSTNGKASAELQSILFSASAPAYGSTNAGDSENTGSAENTGNTGNTENTGSSAVGSYSDYRTLKNGNSGEDVKVIQRRLKELGYFNGDIGGNYLTKTQAAVELFQTALGLSPDGIATPELQIRILSSTAPAYIEVDAPDQLIVLSRGDDGTYVKKLQQRLIALGWLSGSADGDFGAATENALMAFQYRVGLEPDGIAGIEVQDRLYAASAPHYVAYTELRSGAQGEGVLLMQMRLIELGYLSSNAANMDGIYGSGLKSALIKLQIASGVDPELADGIATIELQEFLFSANADLYSIAR